MKFRLLITIAVFSPLMVHAESLQISESECGAVDQSQRFGAIRDQSGSGGLCYAFVAADLINDALGISPSNPVSALHVAHTFNTATPKEARAGGNPESDKGLGQGQYRSLFERVGGWEDVAVRIYGARGRLCLESDVPSTPVGDRHLWYGRHYARYYNMTLAPNGHSGADVARLLPPSRHLEAAERLRQDMDNRCRPDARLNNLGVNVVERPVSSGSEDADSNRRLLAEAQNVLNSGRPFAMQWNFCPFMLRRRCQGDQASWHASSVVGRRWNNGRCEYLIRNSFGTQFNECAPGSTCVTSGRHAGHQWVSATELIPNMNAVTTTTGGQNNPGPQSPGGVVTGESAGSR